MIDLTFLSSNSKKLANFRHLARGQGVRVLSFHERTFHASYEEPREDDRSTLLDKSYDSALTQWVERAGLSDEEFFFFEDTSLSVNALSGVNEYPGVNVKYWMQSTSFSELDAQLKDKGNDRSVSVRSDIVLHIPPSIRKFLNVDSRYVQFTGVSAGNVAEVEFDISPSLIRPWQDSSSFNKWFVPSGELVPFSLLDAVKAAEHDFRGRAFSQLIAYIKSLGIAVFASEVKAEQLSLDAFPKPPILVICGPTCSGKTTAADHLVDAHGYMHFEASDFMRMAFYEMHGRRAGPEISEFARQVLAEEPWTVPERISEHLSKFSGVPIVVTGFRSPLELAHFKSACGPDAKIQLVYIDADVEARYERAVARGRHDAPESFNAFRERSELQMLMGLREIEDRGDMTNFSNCGSKEDLYIFCDRFVERAPLNNFAPLIDTAKFGSLELAAIEVLGRDLERPPATTTEIAALINAEVRGREGTAKDNVSRYFNQRVSPFYMVSDRDDAQNSEALHYTITQTGRAMWKRIKNAPRRAIVRQRVKDNFQMELFPSMDD
ncbi:non-canonical purine NTP pyrophosphatase [Stenotrophomonas sp. AR026]|uniref:non-canonical purine NTP pyrophosphatase n=1 Tax=Stenotrophomonas sp. AR026 TaxID=3398462 RepID=UPI003BB130FB